MDRELENEREEERENWREKMKERESEKSRTFKATVTDGVEIDCILKKLLEGAGYHD